MLAAMLDVSVNASYQSCLEKLDRDTSETIGISILTTYPLLPFLGDDSFPANRPLAMPRIRCEQQGLQRVTGFFREHREPPLLLL